MELYEARHYAIAPPDAESAVNFVWSSRENYKNMPDLVNVTYARTGRSIAIDSLGMLEMQARAFAAGKAQYLLLK